MRKLLTVAMAAAVALTLAGSAFASGPSAAPTKARLSVVHGIPGVDVDVCLNGTKAISDFNPGEIVGPIRVDPGNATAKLVARGADCNAAAILEATVALEAGKAYSAVAHLDANGDPKLSLFTDNLRKTDAGQARLTARHTAAAPEVNVWANGMRGITGFVNGDTATMQVPRGVYAAWVSLPKPAYQPVIGPAVLKLQAGYAYTVYAWGSAAAGSLALAVQAVQVGTK